MSVFYSGGLWSITLIIGVLMGYNWALNGPRWAYKALLGLGVAVIIISQLLPAAHPFRISVAEGLVWWFWAIVIAIPVLAYAKLVRWLRRKAEARHDP